MNLNLLALFLLAKLASSEIEDATSLTQRPENDGYRSPRFLYVPTALDDYEEENLEEPLTNTQKYENEDVTSPQWSENDNYMPLKFLDVPVAQIDYESYEYSGDYEDFEDKSVEERLANVEKIKSWIDRNNGTDLIPNLYTYSGDYEDFEDESLEEFLANLEKNKSWIDRNRYTVYILAVFAFWIVIFGLLWCTHKKFSRPVEDLGAVGTMDAMDPINLDILMGDVGARAPINLAADGAAMGAMDPIDLYILMDAMEDPMDLDILMGGVGAMAPIDWVAVAPPDFSKTVNAMSARGA